MARIARRRWTRRTHVLVAATIVGLVLAAGAAHVQAHKEKHSAADIKLFEDIFMEQVRLGDLLFHGDPDAEKQMGVTLSKTGMSCAMCHPWASDTHPHEFPKFSVQLNQFATLREMINWCIEKPNQGERIENDSEAMKALEAYHYFSARGSKLDPGRH